MKGINITVYDPQECETRTYVTLTYKLDAAGKRVSHCLTVHGMTPEDLFKLIQNAILDVGKAG